MPDCKTDATRAQERTVGQALRGSEHVEKVVFVSKIEALKQCKKKSPALFKQPLLFVNPLPDEWVVTITSGRYDETVGKKICATHYAGVERCSNAGSGGVHWRSTLTH